MPRIKLATDPVGVIFGAIAKLNALQRAELKGMMRSLEQPSGESTSPAPAPAPAKRTRGPRTNQAQQGSLVEGAAEA